MYKKNTKIANQIGLHAKAASEFSKIAVTYKSNIFIEYKNCTINAKSIVGILSAGIGNDEEIEIYAIGEDQEDAVNALVNFIETDI